MATLYEYFTKDTGNNLTVEKTFELRQQNGEILSRPVKRIHYDFDAGAVYISFYIPYSHEIECPEVFMLNSVHEVLNWRNDVIITMGFGFEEEDARNLIFTGRIYLYSEKPVKSELKELLIKQAKEKSYSLIFRSSDYMEERNKFEKPLAFISHDSRDKDEIARKIAINLQNMLCPIWYDEFSLEVGDSLRESIEKGLKECRKCILILSPNFLSNNGWTKKEFDSIFTRELIEEQKLVLPIWYNVTKQDVYNYSISLPDIKGLDWVKLGEEEVCRQLYRKIMPYS